MNGAKLGISFATFPCMGWLNAQFPASRLASYATGFSGLQTTCTFVAITSKSRTFETTQSIEPTLIQSPGLTCRMSATREGLLNQLSHDLIQPFNEGIADIVIGTAYQSDFPATIEFLEDV